MLAYALCLAAYFLGGECVTGNASHYADGVMRPTVELRQEWGQLPQDLNAYDGFVAVVDCNLIGDDIWVMPPTGGVERLLVTDCSGHVSTTQWMLNNGIFGEVDFASASRWGIVGGGDPMIAVMPRTGE